MNFKGYKITAPPAGSKARFGLLKLGNFRTYESFKIAMLGKKTDGVFVLEGDKKYFVTIKKGEIVEEDVRDFGDTIKSRAEAQRAAREARENAGEPATKDENPA